jgi:hypothetical protein
MNYIPVLFFGIAAIGGLTLVTMKNKGKGLPMPLAMGHGLMAAAGLVALIIIVAGDTSNMILNISLACFVAAALGGFTLFSFHVRKKPMPGVLIPVHGIGAVIAFVLLAIAVFR